MSESTTKLPLRSPLTAEIRNIDTCGRFDYQSVPVKEQPTWWQLEGLSFTASGYGARIPTRYMVRVGNRWRRVYCCIYGNSGTLFIGKNIRDGIVVDIWRD